MALDYWTDYRYTVAIKKKVFPLKRTPTRIKWKFPTTNIDFIELVYSYTCSCMYLKLRLPA